MNADKKPFHEVVAEKLIEQLREGTAPWQRPWEPGDTGAGMPFNPTTGKRYKGINALHLMSEGRDDQRWMTYKQATALDAQVRKGEKGTPIQYWQFSEQQRKMTETGKPILDHEGEPVMESVKLERPKVFFATVFNAEQIDGLRPRETRKEQTWNAVDRAEQIIEASGAVIFNDGRDRAFYRPATDSIHLPDKSRFKSADNYYATALHELGHWTGNASRLELDLVHPFGSDGYAKEELRAEIASMILGAELGIGHDPEQHAAYVGSWIRALENDPLEIFRAAADAEKIQDYVLGLEQKQIHEQVAAHAQVSDEHPAAFVDTKGMLRDWITADLLPPAWQGVVKHEGAFWAVGQEMGERTFTILDAATLSEANAEAARHRVLAVDIDAVLPQPETASESIATFASAPLQVALRARGLTTIGSVTGADSTQFQERGESRLAMVFGREHDGRILAKELARKFADKARQLILPALQQSMETGMDIAQHENVEKTIAERAEDWTLARVENNTFARAADNASAAQLIRIQQALNAMKPLSAENPFWQRHALPQNLEALQEKIESAQTRVELRQLDAPVAEARRSQLTAQAFGRERPLDGDKFGRICEEALGFALPLDWNGRVRVEGYGTETVDGEETFTTLLPKGAKPQAWGVFAQHVDGGFAMLSSAPTEQKADTLAERLALIDAHATISEHEKAAKLARINEDRVRRDPNSTDEDIAAAREARKDAEFRATTNDEDLQRRIEFERREQALAAAAGGHDQAKLLINVSFKQKEEAKALGAKWDRQEQSWYVPAGIDTALFAKWAAPAAEVAIDGAKLAHPIDGDQPAPNLTEVRQYLAVPFSERAAAKAAGAHWDKAAKSWYAGPLADTPKLEQWKPENVPVQQEPAMSPREEFADALMSIGCIISGDHPVMDGKTHRITVEGEKFTKNSGSGFYVGHLDGHPAGYVKNNKTGADLNWKSKGYVLDPAQKALLIAEAADKLQQRDAELLSRQEQAAKRVVRQTAGLVPALHPTSYMLAKGIAPQVGALTDKDGKKTYLPATDADGKQWTMQYIQEDGTKRFAKDSRKEGCFHVVGGLAELAKAPALVISEGYATAAQLKQTLGYATVSAFDSSNLALVAQALHQKFPHKPIVIAGDDDRHLEITQGVNPGRTKAEEAARLVGGKVLLPIFAPGENSYPDDFDAVTPAKYRQHQKTGNALGDDQLAALSRMKQFTDFNDLATRSALGLEAADRQVHTMVTDVIAKQALAQTKQQQNDHSLVQRPPTLPAEKSKRRRAPKIA